jgi:hypothetical protein
VDTRFYKQSRVDVHHIDEAAQARLADYYTDLLSSEDRRETHDLHIDLATSWVSHFPDSYKPKKCIGVGMNLEEMAANKQLDEVRVT